MPVLSTIRHGLNTGGSMQRWYRETEQMKTFARYRPLYLKSHMIDFFDIDSMRISSLPVQPRFLVFPNPCGNLLVIEFQDPNIHFENYIIHDVYGRIALSGDLEPGKIVYHLDLTSLPKGSYILRVQSATEILHKTIIKSERQTTHNK